MMAAQVTMTPAEYRRFVEATAGDTLATRAALLDSGAPQKPKGIREATIAHNPPPVPFAAARACFAAAGRALSSAARQHGGRGIGAYRYTDYASAVAQRRATRTMIALGGAALAIGAGMLLLATEGVIRGITLAVRSMRGR